MHSKILKHYAGCLLQIDKGIYFIGLTLSSNTAEGIGGWVGVDEEFTVYY